MKECYGGDVNRVNYVHTLHTYSHHNETLYSKKIHSLNPRKKNLTVSPTTECNYRQPPDTTTFTTAILTRTNKNDHRVKKE